MTTLVEESPLSRPPIGQGTRPGAARVLQVALSLGPGGSERLVIELSKRLAGRFGMAVCCLDSAGSWSHELTGRDITVTSLERTPGFNPSLGVRLAEWAARSGAEVLHCHHYSTFVYGSLAALRRKGLRVVFTEHGRLSDGPPSKKRLIANQLFGRLPGQFFAVSEDLKRHLVSEGFPSSRVQVIYNGVDIAAPPTSADRLDARRALSIADTAFVVGTAGRLDPVKDIDTMLEAFALVRSRIPEALLLIIGEGPVRESLQQKASRLGLSGSVRFTGYRSDIQRLLPALDLFVNSSISEGVSLTILEAMAACLPVVATCVGGTPEVVDAGVTGVLAPARAPELLAHAINDVVRQPARAAMMGAAGRRRVEARFNLDRMVGQYASVYESLVRCDARRPRMLPAEGR